MADETAAAEVAAASAVRLRSSDGHLVPVDRLTLAAASSVFRDMMAVVSSNEEAAEDCPVSETLEELQILMKGLKGHAKCSEADWLTLYNFMDKYDMEPLRVLLRLMARDMLGKDPIAAYCAGAILSDRKIQNKAARAVIKKQIELQELGRRKLWGAAPEQERLRLITIFQAAWKRAQKKLSLFKDTDVIDAREEEA